MSLLSAQESVFLVNGLHLSANLILVYDHLLTFDSEVEHFWSTPFTLGNALFFANRYFTLCVIAITWATRTVTVTSECARFLAIRELSLVATQTFVMAILFLRTYALYSRSRKIALVLGFAAMVQMAVNLIFLIAFRQTGAPDTDPSNKGCQVSLTPQTSRRIAVPWMTALGIDILVFGLTLARTWNVNARDGLARIVRRDGTLYFGMVVLINLANILAYWMFPEELKDSLSQHASYASVAMASRLCLNIQRPPPPHEFTSVLPSLDDISKPEHRSDWKLGPRPLTWASDLTVSGNIHDSSFMSGRSHTESAFTGSDESVIFSPEVAGWEIHVKGLSVGPMS